MPPYASLLFIIFLHQLFKKKRIFAQNIITKNVSLRWSLRICNFNFCVFSSSRSTPEINNSCFTFVMVPKRQTSDASEFDMSQKNCQEFLSREMVKVINLIRIFWWKGRRHSVMANVLDFNIVVSEFELQWHYYIHFRTNTLGKGMNSLIPQLWGK